jgi:hypothetical protein
VPRLDERSLRRAGFAEGRRVELCDGQEWTIPPARIRIRGARSEADDALDLIMDSAGERIDIEVSHLAAWVTVAAALLQRNYTLSCAQVAELLDFDASDPKNGERWTAIRRAILGVDPDGDRPYRTFSRWVRFSLLINDIDADLTPCEASEYAYALLAMGRTVSAAEYCDFTRVSSQEQAFEELI